MYPPIAPLKIGLRGGYIPSLAFLPNSNSLLYVANHYLILSSICSAPTNRTCKISFSRSHDALFTLFQFGHAIVQIPFSYFLQPFLRTL